MPDLETNRTFLIHTIKERSNKGLWETFEQQTDEDFISYFEGLIQLQVLPEGVRNQIRKEAPHIRHPLDNPLIKSIEHACCKMIGHHKTQLSKIPAGLVLNKYLNAEVLKGESNEIGILIDLGIISSLEQMLHAFLRFSRYHNPIHRYRTTCAQTLYLLSDFCVTGNLFSFSKISPIPKICATPVILQHVLTCHGLIDTFILLHEYAHVVLGHLDDCQVNATDRLIKKNRAQEIQADEQAVQWLIGSNEYRNIVPSVCHILGLLFRFQDLCETHPSFDLKGYSHPSAMERWEQIKVLLSEENSACIKAAIEVDEPYDEVVALSDDFRGQSSDCPAINGSE